MAAVKVGSFVKDEERSHDDVSGVFGWIRVVSLKQAKVGDGVGPARVELEEDRSRHTVSSRIKLTLNKNAQQRAAELEKPVFSVFSEQARTCLVTSTLQGFTCSPSHQPPRPYSHVPCSFGTAPSFTRVVQPSGVPDAPQHNA